MRGLTIRNIGVRIMKDKILGFLKVQKDYLSGEEISQRLGVTRAAVWKAIKKLQAQGYEIDSSTKKGYRLMATPNIVTASEILSELTTKEMGQTIVYLDEIDSTNNEAKRLAREGAKEGTLIIADCQKSGKGRMGRVWSSPSGEGIWMSLILRPSILPREASQLTLIAGVAMAEAIEKVTGLTAEIKWPNDIVIHQKKVCGILTEMSAQIEGIEYVVLGIGVNVNMIAFTEELPYATSLAIEGKREYSRKQIIARFLEIFEEDYKVYTQQPNLHFIKERYEARCITLHKKVKLIMKDEEKVAQALEINEEGELVVKLEEGSIEEIASGEVSVRGLYGYI